MKTFTYVIGTINRKVAKYKVHSDLFLTTIGTNLAILSLMTPVEYSPFIKPICLWSGSTTLQNVIGKIGYVVKWSKKNKFGHLTMGESLMIRAPIVSQVRIYTRADFHCFIAFHCLIDTKILIASEIL